MPTQLGHFSLLSYLGVDKNRLSGTLVTQIGRLSSLQQLDADSNLVLSGTLPSQLAQLSSLIWLDLYKNRFSGTLASTLGRLPLTRDLRIHANRLSGTLPTELGALDPWYCYLTNEQCVEEGGGDEICESPGAETSRFACPLPPRLLNASSGCGGHGLKCSEQHSRRIHPQQE